MLIKNPKIHLEIAIDYEVEGGLVLEASEVKSLRASSPSLKPTYCYINKGEVFVRHLNLSKAKNSERDKKILLHRKQINKIMGYFSSKNYIIVPIELYEKKGLFKILIGIGIRLKKHDKREAIKNKEMKNEIKQSIGF